MTAPPLVSVIVPAYNAEAFLGDAIASALAQTHAELDIVIVDDGSTDRTAEVAERLRRRDPRVTVIHRANGGLAAARNTGLRAAHGEYSCFLDADDAFLADKVQKQVGYLSEHPEYDLVYSDFYYADAALRPTQLSRRGVPPLPFPTLLVYRNWFEVGTTLVRSSLTRAVGEFDETLKAAEDWDYWIRCAAYGTFAYLPGVVSLYRRHGNQMSRQYARMRNSQMQLIAKHYATDDRRRRMALGARHWDYARNFLGRRAPLATARELLSFALAVGSPRDMKRIIDLNREPS